MASTMQAAKKQDRAAARAAAEEARRERERARRVAEVRSDQSASSLTSWCILLAREHFGSAACSEEDSDAYVNLTDVVPGFCLGKAEAGGADHVGPAAGGHRGRPLRTARSHRRHGSRPRTAEQSRRRRISRQLCRQGSCPPCSCGALSSGSHRVPFTWSLLR